MDSLILHNPLIDVIITELYQAECSLFSDVPHDFLSEFNVFKVESKLGDELGLFIPKNNLINSINKKKILIIIGRDEDDSFFELMKYQNFDLSNYHVCICPSPTFFAINYIKNIIEYNIYCALLDYLNNFNNEDLNITTKQVIDEIFNDDTILTFDLPEYKSDFNYDDYAMFQYPFYAFLADKFEVNKKIGIKLPFLTDVDCQFYIVFNEKYNGLIKLVGNENHVNCSFYLKFINLFNDFINGSDLPNLVDFEFDGVFKLLNNLLDKNLLDDELECDENIVDKITREGCRKTLKKIKKFNNYILDDIDPIKGVVNRSTKINPPYEVYFNELNEVFVKGNKGKIPSVKIIEGNDLKCIKLTNVRAGCWMVNLKFDNPLRYEINTTEGTIIFGYLDGD